MLADKKVRCFCNAMIVRNMLCIDLYELFVFSVEFFDLH